MSLFDPRPFWMAPTAGRLAPGATDHVTRELEGVPLPAFPQPNAASRPLRQTLPLHRAPGTAAELVAGLAKGWRA